ncbi:hypothetical protein NMT73_24940, partial [Escherichia coli]|nr:hypothetical protein [Escherichia coli]
HGRRIGWARLSVEHAHTFDIHRAMTHSSGGIRIDSQISGSDRGVHGKAPDGFRERATKPS